MSFTGHENHTISLQDAAELTANYRNSQTTTPYIKGEYFGKDALISLLDQTDCVGVRIYYGLTDAGVKELVIVGVDASENDLIDGEIMEMGRLSPPFNSTANALNS